MRRTWGVGDDGSGWSNDGPISNAAAWGRHACLSGAVFLFGQRKPDARGKDIFYEQAEYDLDFGLESGG
jgi:hypothetical protein